MRAPEDLVGRQGLKRDASFGRRARQSRKTQQEQNAQVFHRLPREILDWSVSFVGSFSSAFCHISIALSFSFNL